jgi:hypothetical protein
MKPIYLNDFSLKGFYEFKQKYEICHFPSLDSQ